jgi:hypothetical protein
MSDYKVVNSRGKEISTDVTLHPEGNFTNGVSRQKY